MLTLSAPDAISPAIHRTRQLLFHPFRLGTFLKLCLVAVFTEGFSGNFNFGGHGGGAHNAPAPSPAPSLEILFSPVFLFIIFVAIVFGVAISLLVLYLITRLRFALFECLTRQSTLIAPGWSRYREPARRFFWLNVVVGLVFLLVIVLIAIPFAAGFYHFYQSSAANHSFDLGRFLSLILPLIPIIILLVLAAIATDIILRDFMLPHYALENATAGHAWAAVRARIAAEKGPFFVYALLRIFLPALAIVAIFLVLVIPSIVVIAVTALSFAGLHAAFTHGGLLGIAFAVLAGIVVVLAVIAYLILAALCFGGPLSLAVRNYALVFYGGRYQPLGDILFPPPASQPAPGA